MKKIFLLLLAGMAIHHHLLAQPNSGISIIPQPVKTEAGSGRFTLRPSASIEVLGNDRQLEQVARFLAQKLNTPTGYNIQVKKVTAFGEGNIQLQLGKTQAAKPEGYELTADEKRVTILADSAAGIFYGVQTLLQLLPNEIQHKKKVENIAWELPAVRITDYPRFAWRGALFDVSRHFFNKQEVKDFIDDIARYKFNIFHFHLTDDQGWRIEIKSLPKLTEVGAWRPEQPGPWGARKKPAANAPKTYGGFYTHDDIRELIQYASERFVQILPEIDVPGHSLAAVASYPELSCTTDSTYQVNTGEKFMNWHSRGFSALLDNTLCPANEKVYPFLDKVFTEVAGLFPFPYIHMGGDECAKNFWEKNPRIRTLMQKENLRNMGEVQSYFVKRVEKIIRSKGKKLIGWDEILEGGLPPDATVMSWRGMKGGIQAAKLGHQVVMTPATHVYVDLYQGDPLAEPPTYGMVRLRDAYRFEPVPAGVDEKLILGGQANLWTERLQNTRAAQYMMWPRALAVAESVWSPASVKNWNSFLSRVENEFQRMDAAQIKYSRSMYDPILKPKLAGGNLQLEMETEIESLSIHYSFDASNPDNFYPKYNGVLTIPKNVPVVKVVTFAGDRQMGKQIDIPVEELTKRVKK